MSLPAVVLQFLGELSWRDVTERRVRPLLIVVATEQIQFEASMSRKGNCYDNALGESFWATVKTECFDNFRSGLPKIKAQAMTALFHYIELFYNQDRLHSALDYRSPVQFEKDWSSKYFTDNVST